MEGRSNGRVLRNVFLTPWLENWIRISTKDGTLPPEATVPELRSLNGQGCTLATQGFTVVQDESSDVLASVDPRASADSIEAVYVDVAGQPAHRAWIARLAVEWNRSWMPSVGDSFLPGLTAIMDVSDRDVASAKGFTESELDAMLAEHDAGCDVAPVASAACTPHLDATAPPRLDAFSRDRVAEPASSPAEARHTATATVARTPERPTAAQLPTDGPTPVASPRPAAARAEAAVQPATDPPCASLPVFRQAPIVGSTSAQTVRRDQESRVHVLEAGAARAEPSANSARAPTESPASSPERRSEAQWQATCSARYAFAVKFYFDTAPAPEAFRYYLLDVGLLPWAERDAVDRLLGDMCCPYSCTAVVTADNAAWLHLRQRCAELSVVSARERGIAEAASAARFRPFLPAASQGLVPMRSNGSAQWTQTFLVNEYDDEHATAAQTDYWRERPARLQVFGAALAEWVGEERVLHSALGMQRVLHAWTGNVVVRAAGLPLYSTLFNSLDRMFVDLDYPSWSAELWRRGEAGAAAPLHDLFVGRIFAALCAEHAFGSDSMHHDDAFYCIYGMMMLFLQRLSAAAHSGRAEALADADAFVSAAFCFLREAGFDVAAEPATDVLRRVRDMALGATPLPASIDAQRCRLAWTSDIVQSFAETTSDGPVA